MVSYLMNSFKKNKPKAVATTVAERQDSERHIFKEIQRSAFKIEIASLSHREQNAKISRQSSLLKLHSFIEQGSSVSPVTVNDDSGTAISPSISRLIKASVAESIGALTDGITQVIEDHLGGFAKRFSEENSSTVEQAVKKTRRELSLIHI